MKNEEVIIGLLTDMKAQLNSVEERLTRVEGSVIRIENEHGAKLNALFDGQKQLSDKVGRIETEVSKHEEVIMRRLP